MPGSKGRFLALHSQTKQYKTIHKINHKRGSRICKIHAFVEFIFIGRRRQPIKENNYFHKNRRMKTLKQNSETHTIYIGEQLSRRVCLRSQPFLELVSVIVQIQ